MTLGVSSVWAHPTISKYTSFLLEELNLDNESAVEAPAFNQRKLKDLVKNTIASITKIVPTKIKENDTFKSMGVDSMQALQIKNTIQAEVGLTLAASSIWAHPTVEKYSEFLFAELGLSKGSTTPAKKEVPKESSDVEDLSLDELMQQLDDKTRDS